MIRKLMSFFTGNSAAACPETESPYAPPSETNFHVDLYITQEQIDNGALVKVDVPGVATIDVPLPTIAQDGFTIRILDVPSKGRITDAHLHVVSENK